MSAVGVTLLTLAAVHAPGRIKLLGLYALAIGLVAGFGMGSLSRMLNIGAAAPIVLITFLLIVAAQTGMAVESHRLWAAKAWEAFEATPQGRLAKSTTADPRAPADFKAGLQELIDRQRESLRFGDYLAHRISPLGEWREPWPLVFWLGESIVSAVAGTFVFWRQSRARVAK